MTQASASIDPTNKIRVYTFPNWKFRKFVIDKKFHNGRTFGEYTYDHRGLVSLPSVIYGSVSTETTRLIQALVSFPGIAEVIVRDNSLSITLGAPYYWAEIQPLIIAELLKWLGRAEGEVVASDIPRRIMTKWHRESRVDILMTGIISNGCFYRIGNDNLSRHMMPRANFSDASPDEATWLLIRRLLGFREIREIGLGANSVGVEMLDRFSFGEIQDQVFELILSQLKWEPGSYQQVSSSEYEQIASGDRLDS